MKFSRLLLLAFAYFISTDLFAQSPHAIEDDLLKSFKKIAYWDQKRAERNDNILSAEDSLDAANKAFAKKLKYYAEKFPATIIQPFIRLQASQLNISTSADGLLKVYSWDTLGGGTLREFESIFQYKSGNVTHAIIDTGNESNFGLNFNKIFTLKVGNNTHYLIRYLFIESSRYYGEGIQCYTIENGKLNDDSRIIKTHSGMHSTISYEADFSTIIEKQRRPTILFSKKNNTFSLPLIQLKGQVTSKYINYKFNGKYFERVKG